ncbi:MAG: hypothetical protein GY725_05035 [bacterium]|nr:hypothetical protein [bacterium]
MNMWKWIRYGVVAAVVLAFVLVFGQPGSGGNSTASVAEVNGEAISRDVFEFFREINDRNLKEFTGGLDAERLRALLDERTRNGLIQRYIVAQEARALGLNVPDAALRVALQSNPDFQSGGVYNRELLERYLARVGLGTREYMEEHRRDLLTRKFSRMVESTVRVSDAAVRDSIIQGRTTLKLRVATAEAKSFEDRIELSDEEVSALVDGEPERIRALYQSRESEFRQAEELRARHILFAGDDGAARALKAKARVEAGEDFADVAKELSDDAATKEQGGDLGRFPRGRMMAPFDEVAFGLEVGAISGPVETERGVHLIRVDEHQEAVEKSFESVAQQLARELLTSERAAGAARTAIDELIKKAQAGESFLSAAASLKIPVEVTPPFQLSEGKIPGLDGVEGIVETAFALSEENPVAARTLVRGNSFFAIDLLERSEPEEESIQAAMTATREKLLQNSRALTSNLWLNERRRELEQAGAIRLFDLYPQN